MQQEHKPKKPNNLKTAMWVGALALFFFLVLFVKRTWFMP